MELKKGQNMIEHEEEIYSRPARTWFQTGTEKEKAEGSSQATLKYLSVTYRFEQLSAKNPTRLVSNQSQMESRRSQSTILR